jgi:hypothetical protein
VNARNHTLEITVSTNQNHASVSMVALVVRASQTTTAPVPALMGSLAHTARLKSVLLNVHGMPTAVMEPVSVILGTWGRTVLKLSQSLGRSVEATTASTMEHVRMMCVSVRNPMEVHTALLTPPNRLVSVSTRQS